MSTTESRPSPNVLFYLALSEKVYEGPTEVFNEAELKARPKECCDKLSLREIRKVISCWKKRLRAVFEADGGHIDHLFQ
jgi:hypothetical protein